MSKADGGLMPFQDSAFVAAVNRKEITVAGVASPYRFGRGNGKSWLWLAVWWQRRSVTPGDALLYVEEGTENRYLYRVRAVRIRPVLVLEVRTGWR